MKERGSIAVIGGFVKVCYTFPMLSRDVLFYALAVAAVAFTVTMVWTFIAILRIFRSFNGLVEDFRNRLGLIDEILHTIQDKISSTHIQLTALAGGLKELIGFFVNRRAKRAKSSKRASADEDDF